jgi:hypothetical protein
MSKIIVCFCSYVLKAPKCVHFDGHRGVKGEPQVA